MYAQEYTYYLYNTLDPNYDYFSKNDKPFENKELPRSPSISSFSESYCSSCIRKNNNNIKSNILRQFKAGVNKQTRFFVHKIKLYKNTLS
jgi:chloramphenicol O-acetyltransferase